MSGRRWRQAERVDVSAPHVVDGVNVLELSLHVNDGGVFIYLNADDITLLLADIEEAAFEVEAADTEKQQAEQEEMRKETSRLWYE